MVSSSSGDALGLSSVDSSLSGCVSHDLQLSGNEFSAPASRMAYLREKFASQNLSGTARDLLLASWRTKSNKPYTIPTSINGYAGALQGVQIPFLDL